VWRYALVPHGLRQVRGPQYRSLRRAKSIADLIHGKNPYCETSTWEAKVADETAERLREHVRESDIVVCVADGPDARKIVNRLCVEEKVTCIMAGLRERAYGGQVLVIRPGQTLCHACYVTMSGGEPLDQEISNPEQAERIAYADRPVPVEPGLSLDIAPINLMVTKLVVQELLKGRPTTLRSLDEDLVAPFYLWLNRRDADSPFAALEPMGFEVNGMRILRWYGVPLERDPECSVCGDLIGSVTKKEGVEIREEDLTEFL
jgi:molybdopterin/thiamine biosynthesis adenylyltransferase